jgi:aspartyl-tRNA(Asn)/glutamyl-tRNA(Gln) amidotransferase subunit C
VKFAGLRPQNGVCYRLPADYQICLRHSGARAQLASRIYNHHPGVWIARPPQAASRNDADQDEPQRWGHSMSVDTTTVRRIAHLARIAVKEDEVEHLKGEINDMLAFVEQLAEVDISGVEPMTSVTPVAMKKRPDVVTDGEIADDILKNAPAAQDHFFLVPKVIE